MLRRHMRLSKSRLVAYKQCPKRLWLQTYRRELAQQSEAVLNRMAQGHMVGATARRLHPAAVATTRGRLQQARALADRIKASPAEHIARCVQRISLGAERMAIAVRLAAVWGSSSDTEHDDATTELGVPLQLRRCGMAMRLPLNVPGAAVKRLPDPARLTLLGKAHEWFGRLTSGRGPGIAAIAKTQL